MQSCYFCPRSPRNSAVRSTGSATIRIVRFLIAETERHRYGWHAAEKAAFMADSQVPWGMGAISGAISEPAWRTKASWYMVTTEDKMIPPDAQRAMSKRAGSTVVEVKGSHAIYVSQPGAVAKLIEEAARGARATAK
jgi:pimeloyl-ACP methyl ester carboxylesterase